VSQTAGIPLFQRELPRLPVPALADTCELYARLVRPLLGRRELVATHRAIEDLLEPGGVGETLQARLVDWSRTSAPDNWLEPFWDDWYLCDDAPLVVNVSPGFALTGAGGSQTDRAARLLAAALRIQDLVAAEQLEPDLEADGSPRCMREYKRLFASTRIPCATRDVLCSFPDSRHVVVVHGHRFFLVEARKDTGQPRSAAEFADALRHIVEDSEPPQPSPGVLTSGRRRAWAGIRGAYFERGPASNRALLEAVESAVLVLVLEDGPPPEDPRSSEAASLFLHGDVRKRWFDKSIQLVVASNGVAGFCMEHSGFDGSTAVRLAELLVANEAGGGDGGAGPEPQRLRYEETEPLREEIRSAEREADALIARTDVAALDFGDFGKHGIVRHGVSPDGFVQMALQLASFTLSGEIVSTYESVDTKRFLHGRTEVMRSVSVESAAFVRSVRGGGSPQASADLLRAAVTSHAATLRRCKEGRGVDRHLLGLRRMLQPGDTPPALFADKGYATLSRSVLSTSSLPSSPGVALTCFGPVVDEGFGLSYTVHDDSVCCVITNLHGLARPFAEELERSLVELRELLSRAP
jgi:carnitine O-acetyltransferase